MIPHIINFCWFGKAEHSDLMERCIESWKKYCPGYEIIEWNEENFDINFNEYTAQAYECKKYAFVSDVARLKALYENGGYYFDTDLELIKKLDDVCRFACVMGFEDNEKVGSAFIGAQAKHPFIAEALHMYEDLRFITEKGMDCTPNVDRLTEALAEKGLIKDGKEQLLGDIQIYPMDRFTATDLKTGKLNITENTYAVHHFEASWMTKKQRQNTRIAQIIGPKNTERIKRLIGRQS